MSNAILGAAPVRLLTLALVLAAGAVPAWSQNLAPLMRNMPAERFNNEDMRLFNEAAKKALSDTAVGESVTWANPATRSRGDLKVLKEFVWKDHPCRQLSVSNQARGRSATSAVNLCRIADNWRLVSPTELQKR